MVTEVYDNTAESRSPEATDDKFFFYLFFFNTSELITRAHTIVCEQCMSLYDLFYRTLATLCW